jgi:hypothetical protein
MGRWIRRSSGYPTWFPRIFRRGRVRVEREINEAYVADGLARQLKGHIHHHPFNKGLDWWFERHNRYSSMEARALAAERAAPLKLSALASGDPTRRRAALKSLAYRMPGRPLLVFVYLYFVRRGFLDGVAGYRFASLRRTYELMIDAKTTYNRYLAHQARYEAGRSKLPAINASPENPHSESRGAP